MTEGQTGVAGKTNDSRKMAAPVSDVSMSCVQLETVCVNNVLVRWHQLEGANWVCPFPTEFPIQEHGKFLEVFFDVFHQHFIIFITETLYRFYVIYT